MAIDVQKARGLMTHQETRFSSSARILPGRVGPALYCVPGVGCHPQHVGWPSPVRKLQLGRGGPVAIAKCATAHVKLRSEPHSPRLLNCSYLSRSPHSRNPAPHPPPISMTPRVVGDDSA
jgi:hypothetical protein